MRCAAPAGPAAALRRGLRAWWRGRLASASAHFRVAAHDSGSPGAAGPPSVARAAPPRPAAAIIGRGHFNAEAEAAFVAGEHGPNPHDLTVELLAVLVAHHHHHRILPGAAFGGVADGALDLQGIRGLDRGPMGRGVGRGIETQVMPARRAAHGALQDRGLAVRTGARGTRRARPAAAHEAVAVSALASAFASCLPPLAGARSSPSSQPHSMWPRMREPAATVRVPALRSPLSTALSSSSTRSADSMLPSRSPATVTFSARTPPLSLAPRSMVRSPLTLTSPLNWPAMRTCPVPSILPSMVRLAAISDSLAAGADARGCCCGGPDVGLKSATAGRSSRRAGWAGSDANWPASFFWVDGLKIAITELLERDSEQGRGRRPAGPARNDGGRDSPSLAWGGHPQPVTQATDSDVRQRVRGRSCSAAFAPCTPPARGAGAYMRNTPKRAGSMGALSEAEIPSPSTRRVSAGS